MEWDYTPNRARGPLHAAATTTGELLWNPTQVKRQRSRHTHQGRNHTTTSNPRVWTAATKLLAVAAAITLTYGLWQAAGSNLYAAYQQWQMSRSQPGILVEGMGVDNPTIVTQARGAGTAPAEVARAVPGDRFGRIVIPAIGLDREIVVGVGEAELRKGPGWVIGSAYAGRRGNMVLSGHRTTYGGPFNKLDELKAGDRIEIHAPGVAGGVAIYEVRSIYVVTPEDTWVADPTPGARITLTTCHPKGSSRQRLIVQGELIEGGDTAEALPADQWQPSQPTT